MKRAHWTAVVSFLLVVALVGWQLAAAQAMGRISGKVTDEDGKPVEGVEVTVETEQLPTFQRTATSDDDGKFLITVPDATAVYQFTLQKDGFATLEQEVKPQIGGISFETFELPSPQPVESTAPAAGTEAVTEPMRAPADPALRAFNEAVKAFRKGDLDTAKSALERALERDDELTRAWSMLSYVHLQRGEHEQAAKAAERTLQLDPEDFKALNVRFQAYRELGQEDKAEEAKEALKAAGEAEDVAKRLFNEGVDALATGNLARARASFYEALSLHEGLTAAHEALADVLMRQQEYEAARNEAAKVLAEDPQNVNMLRLRYDAARALGNPETMREATRELLAVDAQASAPTVLSHAERYFDGGHVAHAKALLMPLIAVDDAPAHGHFTLGLAHLNTGEMGKATEQLKAFVAEAPDHPDAKTARSLIEAQK
jgi:tetratricopeptide (TPR) repeat protein